MSGPGKFEGEPDYVEHFWNQEEDSIIDEPGSNEGRVFVLTHEDREKFPDLEAAFTLVLWEDDNGFVHHYFE